MNYGDNGREPLSGLTFERPTPSLERSENQHRVLQTWAIGFFNSVGIYSTIQSLDEKGLIFCSLNCVWHNVGGSEQSEVGFRHKVPKRKLFVQSKA